MPDNVVTRNLISISGIVTNFWQMCRQSFGLEVWLYKSIKVRNV